MEIAIEFGGSEFRSLRRESDRLFARRVSTEYLVVEGQDPRRKLIERHAEEFANCDDGLIVYGPAAVDLAELLSLPMQSALEDGKLRHQDPVSRQFLGALVEGLLPLAANHSPCTVVASRQFEHQPLEDDEDLGFLLRLVKLRGYQPQIVSPGLALILAECAKNGFSGIAVKLGTTKIDVSVVHQTRELIQFALPRGGVHLDRQLARQDESYLRLHDGREVLDTRPISNWRTSVQNLNQVTTPRMLELRSQYRELFHLLLYRLRQELTLKILRQLPAELPLIVSGSLAAPDGIESLFLQSLQEVSLPLKLKHVSRVQDITYATLRGSLIAGQILPVRETPVAA